ncbi:hypothetical protein [Streptococcus hyointestinalis]|uniref:hypothetical protein n=1 Tax=Streptococcus hyointestinalis TaxID=1337 RepID=UPI0013DF1297|nr:hypothetical protein [Streptococcus hyointestinalis]
METTSTRQLIPRLLAELKPREPAIGPASIFAVLGFVLTGAIPVLHVRLTLAALVAEKPELTSLVILLVVAL